MAEILSVVPGLQGCETDRMTEPHPLALGTPQRAFGRLKRPGDLMPNRVG